MKRLIPVVLMGLVLVVAVISPQLRARLFGQEYLVRVAPVDPIDPFRGAYVALTYPDLQPTDHVKDGPIFLTLDQTGGHWVATGAQKARPVSGVYVACTSRRNRVDCGIDSWFVAQDKARQVERDLADGAALARLAIDDRGHASVIRVE